MSTMSTTVRTGITKSGLKKAQTWPVTQTKQPTMGSISRPSLAEPVHNFQVGDLEKAGCHEPPVQTAIVVQRSDEVRDGHLLLSNGGNRLTV